MAGSLRLKWVRGLGSAGLCLAICLVAPSRSSLAEPATDPDVHTAQNAPQFHIPSSPPHLKVRESPEASGTCAFPWTYSKGLQRCVCVRDGYNLQRGDCLPGGTSAACADNERWSRELRQCICAKGLRREGSLCVAIEPGATTAVPTAAEPPSSPVDPRMEAIARTQRCFKELGYYNGPIDGITNEDTWTAHWYFKREHGLTAYSNFLDEPVQRKLFSLCTEQQQAAPEPTSEDTDQLTGESEDGQFPFEAREAQAGLVSLDVDCLPEDLLSLLQRTQSRTIAVDACMAACLPAPKGLTDAALDKLKAQTGMAWCEACVPIEGHLALDDVQRIERAGNLQLCATPPTQLPRYEAVVRASETAPMRVRTFYRSLPPAAEDENAIALIVGNHNYTSLPVSQTSRADADAFYSLLTEHLGYRQDNIIDVRDAKRDDLARLFGGASGAGGELSRLVSAHPEATVVVYYSGWGATDGAQSETYLLPVNTVRYREEYSGYPLSQLYANLEALKVRSVLLLLEADFGRDHNPYLLPPNMPETVKSVLPPAPVPGVTVLAAADQGQRALMDVSYGLGLFTRYLIEGLSGDADLAPIGNGDGKIDSIELYVYAAERVQLAARKSFGLLQRPAFSGAAAMTVSGGERVSANAN